MPSKGRLQAGTTLAVADGVSAPAILGADPVEATSGMPPAVVNRIPNEYEAFAAMDEVSGPTGAQAGRWYRDDSGQEFFVKRAPGRFHAYNEAGALIVYELAGAIRGRDVPHVRALQAPNGDWYLASQKVEGVGPRPKSWWEGPESAAARRAAERLWAVDCLLSHHDVVGANPLKGYDNLLVTADGERVFRVEGGGAMATKGLGAPKAGWKVSAPWVEPWTMRGIPHQGVPGGPTAKRVFGSITDGRAAALLTTMHAHLDLDAVHNAWTATGMSADQVSTNLGVLKSRLDQVETIVGKLGGSA